MDISTLRLDRRYAGRILCLAIGMLAVAGCSDARRTLGLERIPPDEFTVVSRAPLSIPPEFNLRPPRPGAPRPQEGTVRDQAAAAVFGAGTEASSGAASADFQLGSASATTVSPGEAALLAQAGAEQANPEIRQIVDRESTALAVADRTFIDRLIFWQDQPPPGTVVDARLESQRLRENAALGQPVTEGETPIIVRKKRAPLEGLFN